MKCTIFSPLVASSYICSVSISTFGECVLDVGIFKRFPCLDVQPCLVKMLIITSVLGTIQILSTKRFNIHHHGPAAKSLPTYAARQMALCAYTSAVPSSPLYASIHRRRETALVRAPMPTILFATMLTGVVSEKDSRACVRLEPTRAGFVPCLPARSTRNSVEAISCSSGEVGDCSRRSLTNAWLRLLVALRAVESLVRFCRASRIRLMAVSTTERQPRLLLFNFGRPS